MSLALGLLFGFCSGLGQLASTAADSIAASAAPGQAPTVAPQIAKPSAAPGFTGGKEAGATPTPAPAPAPQPAPSPGAYDDKYPLIGQLEQITFGFSKAQAPIEERLTQLEKTIFQQTHPQLSLFDRTQRLKDTLLGPRLDPNFPPPHRPTRSTAAPEMHTATTPPPMYSDEPEPATPGQTMSMPPKGSPPEYLWSQPEFQKPRSREELDQYALELINQERGQLGVPALQWDNLAAHVAKDHVADLVRRNVNSHLSAGGANPDQRYTEAGGNDAISEHLVGMASDVAPVENRALIARSIFMMKGRQDDRDALFSIDATHFGFGFGRTHDKLHVVACAEVIVKHGMMHPIPHHTTVGEKIEVKGVILQPYAFQKVTLAWEGLPEKPAPESEGISDEAMPYFPPLDFVAYAQKSERDWEKTKTILRTLGVMAAIAGGMFIPPVALAAPLIAVAGTGTGELKAAQDIPVKGGMKLQGSLFEGDVPIDNSGKDGLYYVTVWACGSDGKPVPVSRRTIVAKGSKQADTPPKSDSQEKPKGKE